MNICCSLYCLRMQACCAFAKWELSGCWRRRETLGEQQWWYGRPPSPSVCPVLQNLCKALRAYEGHPKAAVTQQGVHVQLMLTGKQTQINSLLVCRFFFQADVQIFPTWVQSHDVLHLYFLKACRDELEAPQWSHYCQSESALSLAARMVLKIYITVMGHEQIWLENIITFPKGLHTVIQECIAVTNLKKKKKPTRISLLEKNSTSSN